MEAAVQRKAADRMDAITAFRRLIPGDGPALSTGMIDSPQRDPEPAPRWLQAGLVVALIGYAIFVGFNFAPVAAGADSGGYLNSARLLAQGKLATPLRALDEYQPVNSWAHTPLGFLEVTSEKMLKPAYPVGLPLHDAAAGLIAGWFWGPLFVGVGAALAAVALVYCCLRELRVSPTLAAAGAAALAVSPLLLFTSFTPLSDTLATAWCAFAFLAALKSARGGSWGWAVACGAAFSVAVLVRPTNFILLPVLVLVLRPWAGWLWAGVGAVPGAIVNGLYNHAMYGGAFKSGYGPIFEIFKAEHFGPSLANYRETLPLALPVMFLAPLLLPLLPWRRWPREYGACVLWALLFLVFYAFYEFTQQAWWFLRFILPAFPALIILSVGGIEAAVSRAPDRWRTGLRIAAAALVVLGSTRAAVSLAQERHLMLQKEYQMPYVAVCHWARDHMPAGSLVACMQTSSAFYYYTTFPVLRWDAIDPPDFARLLTALQKSGRSFYAVLFPFESDDPRWLALPGKREKVAEVKGVGVWKFSAAP